MGTVEVKQSSASAGDFNLVQLHCVSLCLSNLTVLLQILADALTQCYQKSKESGAPLRLKVFIAGRNRLENEGATALAKAFQVFC